MTFKERKIKEFQEKFIYDFFDDTGLEILGNKEANRPATMDEIEAFLLETIEECRGFVPPEDPTDLVHKDFKQGSRGYNRCREIILNKFEGKEAV